MHQIGSGVLGPVYRARLSGRGPSDRDRLFALKAFHVDLPPEQAIVFGEALQEIADARVSHAAVVSPLGAGLAEGVPYLACEYVVAESLDVRMRPRAALAPEVVLPFVVQLGEALDAAHGQGLVHGALHPRDVLVTSDMARVGGFGVVAALERVGRRGPLRPPYAAPEQVAGAAWGPAADRYALAAVSYELLTGRRAAPPGGRMAGHLERVRDGAAAPRLAPLFEAALAAEPDRRPTSAGQLADELAGALRWGGVAGVRRALAAAGGGEAEDSGGGREPERVDEAPPIAAGGAEPLGSGPAAAAVGGTVMRKRRKRMPWGRKQTEVDWTKRALDLAPPDEGPEANAGGASPVVDGVDDASDPPGPGGDSLEAVEDGAVDGRGGGGDLELRGSVDALADVAEGLDAGLRDGRGGAAAGGAGASRDVEPEAVDGYAPISVGDLESRLDGGGSPAARPEDASAPDYGLEDALEEASEGDEPEAVEPAPASEADASGDADAAGDEADFALTPEEGYDYGLEDDAEPDDPAGEIFDRGAVDEARRLPVGLVAAIGVAVTVTAFVIGLGLMSGGGDEVAPADDGATETASAGEAGLAFSEAGVGEPAPEPVPVESAVEPGDAAAEAEPTSPAAGSPAGAPAREAPPAVPAAAVPRPAPAAVRAPDPPPPAAPPEAAPALAGRLLVRSMPPGAEVVVNGDPRGTTPLALAGLPYGPYEVEVTLAGYGSRRTQLVLDEADPIGSFSADLTVEPGEPSAAGAAPAGPPPGAEVAIGSILAETRPPGAAVWVDQRFVGETPMLIPDVQAGAHQIEFRLDGYRTWTTTVEVVPATQARVAASLVDAAR